MGMISCHLYLPLKVQVTTREENLAFKGHRPHLVRTIDDTSLPRGVRDPTSALQTFRSRRDDAIPLKRSDRVSPPSSSPSESHEASFQRVVTSVCNFREETSSVASSASLGNFPAAVAGHRRPQRDRSSR